MSIESQTFRKDPSAALDYGFDWSDWLTSGEVLSASAWTVPTGINNDNDSRGTDTTVIWLSGGTAGQSYTIACKVTTDDGRIDERSFVIQVENR